MTLEPEFDGYRVASGKLVYRWTALELSNPAADTGDHRRHATPYHTDGEVKKVWTGETTRWLMFTAHDVFHLQNGEGSFHEWNRTYHALPPPVYTYEAIANADMPYDMSPEEFLRSCEIRSLEAMYEELRHPTARERLGEEFVDVMNQILDRVEGAMAELENQEVGRHGS